MILFIVDKIIKKYFDRGLGYSRVNLNLIYYLLYVIYDKKLVITQCIICVLYTHTSTLS